MFSDIEVDQTKTRCGLSGICRAPRGPKVQNGACGAVFGCSLEFGTAKSGRLLLDTEEIVSLSVHTTVTSKSVSDIARLEREYLIVGGPLVDREAKGRVGVGGVPDISGAPDNSARNKCYIAAISNGHIYRIIRS